jgi:hypothetical protein
VGDHSLELQDHLGLFLRYCPGLAGSNERLHAFATRHSGWDPPSSWGAQLETTAGSAKALMADALDLRHRLPELWQLVCSGRLRVWRARRVAHATRHLGLNAAMHVDSAVAHESSVCPGTGSRPYCRQRSSRRIRRRPRSKLRCGRRNGSCEPAGWRREALLASVTTGAGRLGASGLGSGVARMEGDGPVTSSRFAGSSVRPVAASRLIADGGSDKLSLVSGYGGHRTVLITWLPTQALTT